MHNKNRDRDRDRGRYRGNIKIYTETVCVCLCVYVACVRVYECDTHTHTWCSTALTTAGVFVNTILHITVLLPDMEMSSPPEKKSHTWGSTALTVAGGRTCRVCTRLVCMTVALIVLTCDQAYVCVCV